MMQRTNPRELGAVARAVLVVEREPEVCLLLEREHHEPGLRVVCVGTAAAAMDEMRDAFFDLVLTGPRMTGVEAGALARWTKRHHPATSVIVTTGQTDLSEIGAAAHSAIETRASRTGKDSRARLPRQQTACLASVLDRLPLGVILSDEALTVSHTNRTAEAILGMCDGLTLERDRRLYAARRQQTAELRELVKARSRSSGAARAGAAMAIIRPSGRPSLSLLVSALGCEDVRERHCPCAVIFVSDPDRRVTTTLDLLRRLYGLTRAEASLASVLMQGTSVEHACASLGISTNTARTHLKRIFSKTGTARQGELISLLLCSPAVMNSEPS